MWYNMRIFLFWFLSINFSALQCDMAGRGLIAHGNPYDTVEYPYIVCIYSTNSVNWSSISLCTGTIVSPRFVLTAAHCTDNQIDHQVYYACSTDRLNYREVHTVYQHSAYNETDRHADISMLQLQEGFHNIKQYSPISVDGISFDNDTELYCVAIGFGKNELNHYPSNGLMANISIKYGPEACKWPIKLHHWSRNSWKEFVCSKPDKSMICPGDSGGPLICNGYQYGIASHGWNYKDIDEDNIICGSSDIQTRHLIVHQYADWISHTIKNSGITEISIDQPYSILALIVLMLILILYVVL